ncbi:hypothetical protein [Paenibacillus hubeiensis]|uniref:hypothetical protein n=1 Tax=Paenibacillus hubeiensis TaxID=3077330 RepID=UPI0031BAE2B6
MRKFLNVKKTVFSNLDHVYPEIFSARPIETPREELDHKKGREINVNIKFHDYDGYLQCKEIFEGDELIEYYYDWYAGNKEILQKFHAHYHRDETPHEFKKFDPWHFHIPMNLEDKDGQRIEGVPGYTIHDVLSNHIIPYILKTRRSQRQRRN